MAKPCHSDSTTLPADNQTRSLDNEDYYFSFQMPLTSCRNNIQDLSAGGSIVACMDDGNGECGWPDDIRLVTRASNACPYRLRSFGPNKRNGSHGYQGQAYFTLLQPDPCA